jgi:hypothetical protein
MADRYRATELSIDGRRVAAVIDDARRGERFCLIDPAHCFLDSWGGADVALARAKDIAEMANRGERGDAGVRELRQRDVLPDVPGPDASYPVDRLVAKR